MVTRYFVFLDREQRQTPKVAKREVVQQKERRFTNVYGVGSKKEQKYPVT